MNNKKILLALIGLIECFMSGRNYDAMNPNIRPEVVQALDAMGCGGLTYTELQRKFNAGDFDKFMEREKRKVKTLELSTERKKVVGEDIAKLLLLKFDDEDGFFYKTSWGRKTSLGLYETIQTIMRGAVFSSRYEMRDLS